MYLIHNANEMYVGETCSIYSRVGQHLNYENRKKLRNIEVIIDLKLNKSASLDIEQSLIQLYSADCKYKLQNLNSGQSSKHNYYQRELYVNKVNTIWDMLRERGLANNDYHTLMNSDLFKYSPYVTLTEEQREVCNEVLIDILEGLCNDGKTIVIRGSAGTGKTITAINMIFTLIHANLSQIDVAETTVGFSDENNAIHELYKHINVHGKLKIGFVMPMRSLRETVRKVFRSIGNGLSGKMVIGPSDVIDGDYDILFVDEAHRLARRKNISYMGTFDNNCRKLNLDPKETTQLDWIMRSSKCRVLFYDGDQSIKGSDITEEQFNSDLGSYKAYVLKTQMRCSAGDDYPHYLKSIFESNMSIIEFKDGIKGYDLRLFEDVGEMVAEIKALDKKIGLCRNVAGYSWKWVSKNKSKEEIEREHIRDIHIGQHEYVWNLKNIEWILRDDSINEIGCIHTVQGYDLNYVGVIFGEEIDYDNGIVINKSKFYDENVKKSANDDELRKYIVNAYRTMMLRGIRGCYLYVCNPKLKAYLRQFIDV